MNDHGLTRENLVATLPPALRTDPAVVALAEALAGVLAARPEEINRLLIYPAIDTLDEPLLDILAYDFKVDWWDPEYSLEEKRRTLNDSWRVHRMLGTKAAVETAISAIYPNGKVREWFEYGGQPYHFRIVDVDPKQAQNGYDTFISLLKTVKRLSATLDSIVLGCSDEHRLYTGFAVRMGRHTTVSCEIPADLDVTYVTDEAGDLLADEAGNRIID